MSDKDPVREQIERDAEKYSSRFDYDHRPYACEDYDIGASKQDQIAWNRCLDEVIKDIDKEVDILMTAWKSSRAEPLIALKERIEKLRR